MGKRLTINSDKEQILSLLISTFEDVVRTNQDLRAKEAEVVDANRRLHRANADLTKLCAELEQRVEERTAELEQANEKLHAEILEHKRTEATLREQRERFQVTLSSIGDGVIVCDAEGSVTFINPVAEALTGWTRRDALGTPLTQVFSIINEETVPSR